MAPVNSSTPSDVTHLFEVSTTSPYLTSTVETATNSTTTGNGYDSQGAMNFAIAVIMVYGFGIIFIIGYNNFGRKKRETDIDQQVSGYLKRDSIIQLQGNMLGRKLLKMQVEQQLSLCGGQPSAPRPLWDGQGCYIASGIRHMHLGLTRYSPHGRGQHADSPDCQTASTSVASLTSEQPKIQSWESPEKMKARRLVSFDSITSFFSSSENDHLSDSGILSSRRERGSDIWAQSPRTTVNQEIMDRPQGVTQSGEHPAMQDRSRIQTVCEINNTQDYTLERVDVEKDGSSKQTACMITRTGDEILQNICVEDDASSKQNEVDITRTGDEILQNICVEDYASSKQNEVDITRTGEDILQNICVEIDGSRKPTVADSRRTGDEILQNICVEI